DGANCRADGPAPKIISPPRPPSPPSGPPFGTNFSRRKLTHPRPPFPACAKTFTRSTNMASSSCHQHEHVSSQAKSRDPVALLHAVLRDPSTSLRFGQEDAEGRRCAR